MEAHFSHWTLKTKGRGVVVIRKKRGHASIGQKHKKGMKLKEKADYFAVRASCGAWAPFMTTGGRWQKKRKKGG